jgi:hypothetical protein
MMKLVLWNIVLLFVCLTSLEAQSVGQQDSTRLQTSTSANVITQQERTTTSTIFVELLGNSLALVSVSYQYEFVKNFAFKVGLGIIPSMSLNTLITGFIGNGDYRFEYGAGVILDVNYRIGVYPTARLGYRYQPVQGGFNFGIAITPIFPDIPLFGGISLGWGF